MRINEPNRRILIIDDNESIHQDYRKILGKQESNEELDDLSLEIFGEVETCGISFQPGYELDSAYQGQDAYDMVKKSIADGTPYAMAFVDMRMPPGWDGLETIRNLWKADPDLNVVICSAFSDHSWSEVTMKLGSNDRWLLLKKPFDTAEVAQLAAALIEKKRLADELQKKMKNLEVQVAERTADLSERENRLQAILKTAPDGIVLCDANGLIESVNSAAELLLKETQDQVVGKTLASYFDTELRLKQLTESDSDEPLTVDCNCVRTDKSTFPIHCTIGLQQHSSGQGFTAILRDETERERLRCELTQSQKLEAVGQLAAGIAHEINTPTQFLRGNIEFLQESFDDLSTMYDELLGFVGQCEEIASLKDKVTAIQSHAEEVDFEYLNQEIPTTIEQTVTGVNRISKIVHAMKDFSHPGCDEKQYANINSAIESTLTVAQSEWKYVAEVETNFDPELTAVPCLIAELNQVVINLIVNAAHAIGDVVKDQDALGKITVTTRRNGDMASIEISDTGGGIPEAIRHRIFEPFFTTKGVGKGTGQGLAIARSVVVDKHQGTLDCESVMGQGTTFKICLPMNASIENADAAEETSEVLS